MNKNKLTKLYFFDGEWGGDKNLKSIRFSPNHRFIVIQGLILSLSFSGQTTVLNLINNYR